MKAISYWCVAILFTTAIFFSCKKESKQDIPNSTVYDSISVAEIYHLDNDSTKPSCSLRIKYIYPTQCENADILAKIQGELNYALFEDEKYEKTAPSEAISEYVKDYIEIYKKDIAEQFEKWNESDEVDEYFSYYKTLSTNILFDMSGLLSYQVEIMDYKGGSASSSTFRNVVLNLSTGKRISEQDIFIPDYQSPLNSLLIQKIVEKNNGKTFDELLDLGYLGIEDLSSNGNFYVDNKGITYIFNPLEYSISTLGEIRIFLPYLEIKDLLTQNSPISVLID